jgi:hypothetical protein
VRKILSIIICYNSPSLFIIRQPPKLSQLEELEQEMKLLHWHKLANEAALKAALIRTKKLKAVEQEEAAREALRERAEWMTQIVEDEQSKPLEVDSEFIKDYERREALDEERLDREVERHINCLKQLRGKLRAREEVRNRNARYKMEKEALMTTVSDPRGNQFEDTESVPKKKVTGTLSKVIHSLDKLVELEKRITSLEGETGVDKTDVQFAKKKTHGSVGVPSKTYYSMNVNKGTKFPRIGGAGSARRAKPGTNMNGGRLGVLPEVHQSRRMGQRAKGGAGAGSARKGRGAQLQQRQDGVVDDFLQKKQQRKQRPGQRAAKGAASGKRTNNPHMQQFHDIRREFEKKKDMLSRNLDGPPPNRRTGGTSKSFSASSRMAGSKTGARSRGAPQPRKAW